MDEVDVQLAVVRNTAVRLLGRREHSRFELERKLGSRGHAQELVERVVGDLADAGLQSDERFAESFVHSALGRGHGPARIRARLRERGVEDDIASANLDLGDDEWRELATRAVRKRFGQTPPLDRADWAKRARFLAGRGFSADVTARVVGSFEGLR